MTDLLIKIPACENDRQTRLRERQAGLSVLNWPVGCPRTGFFVLRLHGYGCRGGSATYIDMTLEDTPWT